MLMGVLRFYDGPGVQMRGEDQRKRDALKCEVCPDSYSFHIPSGLTFKIPVSL